MCWHGHGWAWGHHGRNWAEAWSKSKSAARRDFESSPAAPLPAKGWRTLDTFTILYSRAPCIFCQTSSSSVQSLTSRHLSCLTMLFAKLNEALPRLLQQPTWLQPWNLQELQLMLDPLVCPLPPPNNLGDPELKLFEVCLFKPKKYYVGPQT